MLSFSLVFAVDARVAVEAAPLVADVHVAVEAARPVVDVHAAAEAELGDGFVAAASLAADDLSPAAARSGGLIPRAVRCQRWGAEVGSAAFRGEKPGDPDGRRDDLDVCPDHRVVYQGDQGERRAPSRRAGQAEHSVDPDDRQVDEHRGAPVGIRAGQAALAAKPRGGGRLDAPAVGASHPAD